MKSKELAPGAHPTVIDLRGLRKDIGPSKITVFLSFVQPPVFMQHIMTELLLFQPLLGIRDRIQLFASRSFQSPLTSKH